MILNYIHNILSGPYKSIIPMFSNIKYQSEVDNIFNINAIFEVNWKLLKNNRKHVNGIIEAFYSQQDQTW